MTVERYCVVCGQPFAAAADEDRCPEHAGSAGAEAAAPAPVMLLAEEAGPAATRRFPTAALVPGTWEPGDLLLDLYEVRGILGQGGMGTVYRVRHRGWNTELAVKSPRQEVLEASGGIEAFSAEAEAWVELGLHPHIVTCHYVRALGGVPRLFAELVEGGSLEDWIEDGRLYAGGPEAALARILDVAVGFAWGLGYAHERGLIHQDVKPANVLLTPDGTAKVTDFGLATARPLEVTAEGGSGSVLVAGAGGTEAYFSPEQADAVAQARAGTPPEERTRLTRRTDVWSWAVSLLDMFTGEPSHYGVAAPAVLAQYVQEGSQRDGPPPMPAGLVALLRECLAQDPAERPHDFEQVAARLAALYREATGAEYRRQKPEAVDLQADSLNNKALSLLDLGREAEAENLFAEALAADPHHPETSYNRGLLLWRRGEITDEELVARLEEVRTSHPDDWRDEYLLALVHIERGDAAAARALLEAAQQQAPDDPEILAALATLPADPAAWCGPLRTIQTARKPHPATGPIPENDRDDVTAVAVAPDGRGVASAGSGDGTVRIWDPASGTCLRSLLGQAGRVLVSLQGHTGRALALAVSPDGVWLASASDDETVRIWDPASGAVASRSCWKSADGTVSSARQDTVLIRVCITSPGTRAGPR